MDVAQCGAAQADSCGHIAQTAFHQHHICRVNGNVCSRSDGDSHIRPCQRRSIIDTVSDHCHLALLLQSANHAFLAVRKHTGYDFVHTGLSADGFCCPFIVAGKHDNTDTHILEFFHSSRAVLFDHIRHSNNTDKLTIPAEEQRCFPLFGQPLCLFSYFLRDHGLFTDKCQVSARQTHSAQSSCQSVARNCMEIICFQRVIDFFRFCHCNDRAGKRMLALLFKGIGIRKQLCLRHTSPGKDICHLRLSTGDRACLIQGDDLGLSGFFQGHRRLEHNAVLRAYSIAHHDCHRSRKPQGAGATDDKDRDSFCQSESDRLPRDQPYKNRHQGNNDDRWDKYPGYPVRHLCNGRLSRRRIAHHLDDLGECSVLAHPRCLAAQESGLV